MDNSSAIDYTMRRILLIVAALNFAYFAFELAVAWWIDSVSLYADAMDFLEDGTLTLMVVWALGRPIRLQAFVALALAAIIAAPGLFALWVAYQKWLFPTIPDARILTLTGIGALVINFGCALALARYKSYAGSLVRAAYLSARNDVIGNIGIIGAGIATASVGTAWPDLIVGLGIFALHAGAGIEVYNAARAELKTAPAS